MDRPATSRDVAARAGVSQSTVSYVFSGKGSISQQTRERVLQAAEELQYSVNLAARSMRTHRSGRIAIVLPVESWHLASMLDGATTVARSEGYAVEVQSLPREARERTLRLRQVIDSGQYEGVLSLAPTNAGPPRAGARTAVVALNDFDEHMHVEGELADPAPLVAMMEELVRMGHRRFLHISGDLVYPSAQARRDAYLATVERLGLIDLGVIEGDWRAESAAAAIRGLPDAAPPLAVIAGNDLVATGVVRGALTRGWTVPGDVSVTGWDDHATSAHQVPSLTTVRVRRHELGKRSMRWLIALMRGEKEPGPVADLQKVIWRESTAAPAASRA